MYSVIREVFFLFIILLGCSNSYSQTRYYYNYYHTPIGSYWIPSLKDSAEFYSETDLDTLYYGGATVYYNTGEIFAKEFYELGYFSGTKRFYKNGKKRYVMSSGTMQSSLEDGATIKVFTVYTSTSVDNSWDSLGNKMVNHGTGYFKNFYNNGHVLCEGEYKNGYSVGDWKGYYPNGNLMYEGMYTVNYHGWSMQTLLSNTTDTLVKKGTGNFVLYYSNGNISIKGRYSSGCLSGEFIMFYPNGKLKEKSIWTSGWYDGPYESYFDNGQLACTGNFMKGRRSGVWKWFNKYGKQIRYKEYEFLSK